MKHFHGEEHRGTPPRPPPTTNRTSRTVLLTLRADKEKELTALTVHKLAINDEHSMLVHSVLKLQ